MKKLWDTLVLTLAVNFLIVAGAVGWLFQSGHLDKERVTVVKETLFPSGPTTAPAATQPSEVGPPAPSQHLEELLSKYAIGRSAAEQVPFMQERFDIMMAQLDRRDREVADRERQVALVNGKLAAERAALEAQRQSEAAKEREADRLAGDKGFQDTLNLYNSMGSRQVKGAFMSMDELSAAQYLDAMQPRTAAKIIKEFKTPDELARMQRIFEKMRHPPGDSTPATQETR